MIARTRSPARETRALPSTLVRRSVFGVELVCLMEMFLSQFGHTQVLEPASEHPVVKRIIGSDFVCLFLMRIGFFEFA